jgi:uncharacterized protein
MIIDPRLNHIVAAQPYPLLFATISGAHLYGFPSPDSDFDLRGAHILPLEKIVGLKASDETLEDSRVIEGLEMDIVTHDVKKFFGMLLKKNGYVLEQLYSPLIVRSTPEHAELKTIAKQLITRHHSHHYLGFADTQWRLFQKENPPRVKPLLYVFRVILTGIHLMRTGEINASLVELNEEFRLPYVPHLVARKTGGAEQSTLSPDELVRFEPEFKRLIAQLESAAKESRLPEDASPTAVAALDDLLKRIRLAK